MSDRRVAISISSLIVFGLVAGCGGNKTKTPSSTPSTLLNDSSGNWQFTLMPLTGPALFPLMSGYLQENVNDTTNNKFTSLEMTSSSSGDCVSGKNSIFLIGNIENANLSVTSTSINGQTLYLDAALDNTSTNLSGKYHVLGGCANGAQGTIAGVRVSRIQGTYSGHIDDAGKSLSLDLVLTQNSSGNGNGSFLLGGSARLAGFSCFSGASIIPSASYVSGTSLEASFLTSDPTGAELVVQGAVNLAASEISLSNITVTSGSCAGTYGSATLSNSGS